MRKLVLAFLVAACGHGSGPDNLIVQDNASDEVYLALLDAEGEVTISDTRAAAITAPLGGPLAEGTTITWTIPTLLRHGVNQGTFVWLRLAGSGEPVDVLSIQTLSYTLDAATVTKLGTGTVTATITTAYVDNGIIQEGPFRPGSTPTYTVGP